MNETTFIHKRQKEWKKYERFLHTESGISADILADRYILIQDDLSYAKTHFSDSPIVSYLNKLAVLTHKKIYKNKTENKRRLWQFWSKEVPIAFAKSHKEMLYALIIFLLAIAVGVVSTAMDKSYFNSIVGDQYVNITNENIKNADPMAIYKSSSEGSMFFHISTNNIRVSFLAYILGIFASIFTGFLLIFNGAMVGTFVSYFAYFDILPLALSTIMIHGTFELIAIVVAGGAGIVLGNSWLYPGTYSRVESLTKSAKQSLKVVVGLIPIFIIAALLESFVTRHYLSLGMTIRILIIALSFIACVWYFIIYPKKIWGAEKDRSI